MTIIRTRVRQSQGGVRPLSSPNWSVHSIRRALTTLRAHLWSLWIRLSFINHDRNHAFFINSIIDFSISSSNRYVDRFLQSFATSKSFHEFSLFERLSSRGRQDACSDNIGSWKKFFLARIPSNTWTAKRLDRCFTTGFVSSSLVPYIRIRTWSPFNQVSSRSYFFKARYFVKLFK